MTIGVLGIREYDKITKGMDLINMRKVGILVLFVVISMVLFYNLLLWFIYGRETGENSTVAPQVRNQLKGFSTILLGNMLITGYTLYYIYCYTILRYSKGLLQSSLRTFTILMFLLFIGLLLRYISIKNKSKLIKVDYNKDNIEINFVNQQPMIIPVNRGMLRIRRDTSIYVVRVVTKKDKEIDPTLSRLEEVYNPIDIRNIKIGGSLLVHTSDVWQ
ncbi:hypothetical protein IZY60_15135 [Lutibacter sp. B2]|nr:hypothetical protein [Lutibacter sp. B2]